MRCSFTIHVLHIGVVVLHRGDVSGSGRDITHSATSMRPCVMAAGSWCAARSPAAVHTILQMESLTAASNWNGILHYSLNRTPLRWSPIWESQRQRCYSTSRRMWESSTIWPPGNPPAWPGWKPCSINGTMKWKPNVLASRSDRPWPGRRGGRSSLTRASSNQFRIWPGR